MTPTDFCLRYRQEITRTLPIEVAPAILSSLEKNYYPSRQEVLTDEAMHGDILANLVRRQEAFERFLIPWINIRRSLAGASVADIGCGTGSSTAAFARAARMVRGYEIDPGPAAVAQDKLNALGFSNATVTRVEPEETIDKLRGDFPNGVDVVALIAVLEHMTEIERMDFLPRIWDFLRPGNILVIAEVPNRLTYNDDHTAQIPFFHMLPRELKLRCLDLSPRRDFTDSMRGVASAGAEAVEKAFCRWGIGLSFHDFEAGFGVSNLEQIMLADGYEHATLEWWPPSVEETVLMKYFLEKPIHKPMGFCRSVLNFIFVKPYPNSPAQVMLRHDPGHIDRVFTSEHWPEGALERMKSLSTGV